MKGFYSIAGRSILIETQDDWSGRAVSNLFSGSFLTQLSHNTTVDPDATVRINFGTPPPRVPEGLSQFRIPEGGVCHTDGQTFHFNFNGSQVLSSPRTARKVEVWIAERYELDSKILAQIVYQSFGVALRRCNLYEFHSAGAIPPGYDRALLVAGASGSGKTTLTLQLAACGWSYISDDKLLLHTGEHGIEVYPLRKTFALTPNTVSALQLSHLVPISGIPGVKERVSPQDLFQVDQVEKGRPGSIVFPILTHRTVSDLRRLSEAETMTRLLRLCPWAGYDKPTATNHLGVLAQLARECVAFELLAGTDLLEDRRRAADLCLASLRT